MKFIFIILFGICLLACNREQTVDFTEFDRISDILAAKAVYESEITVLPKGTRDSLCEVFLNNALDHVSLTRVQYDDYLRVMSVNKNVLDSVLSLAIRKTDSLLKKSERHHLEDN